MKKEENLTVRAIEITKNIFLTSMAFVVLLMITSIILNEFILGLIGIGLMLLIVILLVIFIVLWFFIVDPIIEWRNKKLNKLNSLKENKNEAS